MHTVDIPSGRHRGVLEAHGQSQAYLEGQEGSRHLCEQQQHEAHWKKWHDQGPANCCGKAGKGGAVNSDHVAPSA